MHAQAPEPPWALALVSSGWCGQDSWTVLDTDFGNGSSFLALWHHWCAHARRPAMLHCVGILSQAQAAELPAAGLPAPLAALCYDLEPGFHRLLLQDGQLSLTLCVGETDTMLAHQDMRADSLLVGTPPADWNKWQVKALARCCRRGTQLLWGQLLPAAHAVLLESGFQMDPALTHAVFDPRWPLRSAQPRSSRNGSANVRCAVVGAGLAGASVASALALRGFGVDLYDTQAHPAGGASGLPVGLVVPHHSADDSPRSRLSRQGTRLMLQHASQMLQAGVDWKPGGVLELALGKTGLADAEAEMLSATATAAPWPKGWARPMAYGAAQGLWHPHAAWIKPARLVQQWLDHPRIRFHGQAEVHGLQREHNQWLLHNAQGLLLGRAHYVVFANAHGCVDLLVRLAASMAAEPADSFAWVNDVLGKLQAMQRMHGTVSFGPSPLPDAPDLPAYPVNGHGSFVSGVPADQGSCWYAGATFHGDASPRATLAQEHAANYAKLHTLLPAVAKTLAPQFERALVQAWQGSRCVTHDRLPLVGPLQDVLEPTLWLCAGMGARGLSFSALCAQLLVAQLCDEPLPTEKRLARVLGTHRARRARPAPQSPHS